MVWYASNFKIQNNLVLSNVNGKKYLIAIKNLLRSSND